jgi:hypothetical protein
VPRVRLSEKITVLFVVVLAAVGTLAMLPGYASARGRARSVAQAAEGIGGQYRRLTSEIVHGYASSPERYYAEGVWQNGDPSCWYCNVGPAVGAAYLSAAEPSMRPIAIVSLNRAIAEYRQANGSFSGNTSPAITSAAFSVLLGMSYVELAPQLDEATRTLWQQTLTGIADFLISDRDVTWYANGNVNASYAAALYFAWRASGQAKYLEAYNAELQFLTAPPGQAWVGFGLTITQPPTLANGSDGRGFLTEGSPPGWDPEYSHLQLDFLSALYSASHDPRVLRLLNLILNQELTRVDPSTFILNALGGTRKSEMTVFTSAALPLLVIRGNRPDLAPLLPAAFARLSTEYISTLHYTQHNFYRGIALWLAPILLATSGVPPQVPPPVPVTVSPSSVPTTTGPATTVSTGKPPSQAASRSHKPSVATHAPVISPRVLDARSLVRVADLEVPSVDFAFAAPTTLTRGLAVARTRTTSLSFAAVACTRTCTISMSPQLVVHRGGQRSKVVAQSDLPASHVTLHAGQVFIGRALVPGTALEAARHGRSVLVRLRLTLRNGAGASQARSSSFKVVWR